MRYRHVKSIVSSFREIWKFDKRLIFVLFADIIIDAIRPFPSIILAGRIIDSIADGEDFMMVVFYVALMFGSNFVLNASNTFLRNAREYMSIRLINKLSNDISEKCLNMDFEKFNDSSAQDRIKLIDQSVYAGNFLTGLATVFETVSQVITLIGIVLIMTMLNFRLLFIAVVVIVLQAVLHAARLRHDRKTQSESVMERRKAAYVTDLAKDIAHKKDLVTFNMSGFILRKIRDFQEGELVFDKRRIRMGGIIEMAAYSLSVAFQVSAYILIGINAFRGHISLGDFTVGITSLISFMSSSSFVARNVLNYNDSVFYIQRYKSFLKLRSKFTEPAHYTLADINLDNIVIEFRNVWFRYPNSTDFVLKDVSLTIGNNEKLAIVGFNGAGKTSLILLMTRMYDPAEGAIYLNGMDIREIDYRDYQKIFSTVYQDFNLTAFSLLENIAQTSDSPPEEKDAIIKLIEENDMGARLKKMYRGLDTPVSKRLEASGVDLSGGEQQKVAIVRALYKNSPVLILDEPTAALDPAAEYEIFKKFSEISEGKLTIFISHRIYSTRFCDKIAVFDDGRMVECGTFDELIAKEGLYHDFYQKQAEWFK